MVAEGTDYVAAELAFVCLGYYLSLANNLNKTSQVWGYIGFELIVYDFASFLHRRQSRFLGAQHDSSRGLHNRPDISEHPK